jgi:hypothetical protein
MWKGSHKRLLDEVLTRVPAGLNWRLLWFDGVVHPDYGGAPPINTPIDMALSATDLFRLAAALEDLDDIVLSASSTDGLLDVECEDSGRWIIRGSGSLAMVEDKFDDLL